MKKSGKELESLVRKIEKCLLPESFDVTSNVKKFDNDGVQIVEFDIVISGEIGSSSVNWLVECRDRPSQGAASVEWIEQLIGRKINNKFDKVFAVSTTGFSPPAKIIAKSAGIILRTVSSADEIADDFKIMEFRLQKRDIRLKRHIEITLSDKDKDKATRLSLPLRIKKLKLPNERIDYSIEEFIYKDLDLRDDYPYVEEDANFHRNFEYEGIIIICDDKDYEIEAKKLKIPYVLLLKHYHTEALAGRVYSEENRIIGQEVAFRYDTPKGVYHYTALLVNKTDGTVEPKMAKYIFVPKTN